MASRRSETPFGDLADVQLGSGEEEGEEEEGVERQEGHDEPMSEGRRRRGRRGLGMRVGPGKWIPAEEEEGGSSDGSLSGGEEEEEEAVGRVREAVGRVREARVRSLIEEEEG